MLEAFVFRSIRWPIWFVLLAFTGCVTVPPVELKRLTPEARSALYELSHWQLQGRIAVRTRTDKWQASLRWQHLPEQDNLYISGPLGQGAVAITIRKDFIRLQQSDGQVQTSDNPEQVLRSQLGFPVPLSDLYYWVLGVPGAAELFEPEYDELNRLKTLKQSGWLIAYQRYQTVKQYILPGYINVSRGSVQLKLVVDDWQLEGT